MGDAGSAADPLGPNVGQARTDGPPPPPPRPRERLVPQREGEQRARIASELHDIVGHAISVMVIQAAARQRLVDSDPARAKEAFAAISESALQGTEDLEQLIKLLAGSANGVERGPDLSLVDEVVTRAGRSGLNVRCRFETTVIGSLLPPRTWPSV